MALALFETSAPLIGFLLLATLVLSIEFFPAVLLEPVELSPSVLKQL